MAGPDGRGTVAPEVMQRCHRSYAEALWQWSKACPGAVRRSIGGPKAGVLVFGGIPSPVANILFLVDPPDAVEPWLKEASEFFGPKFPWRVLVMGSSPGDLERWAPAYQLRAAPGDPGMILAPIPQIPPPAAGLRIETVSTGPQLRDFERAWCAAFRVPRWIFPLILPELPKDDPEYGARTRLFVGYAEQRPVACSSVVVTENVANIVSVGTVSPARGRGFGASLTWRAVQEGRDLGADVAYLAASPMGYRVYEKMGFRRAAEYPAWAMPTGLRHLFALLRLWRVARRIRRRHATAP